MSSLRRKKGSIKDDADTAAPLLDKDVEKQVVVDDDCKDAKVKEDEKVGTTQCVAEWALTLVFFLAFYYFTFTASERASHKKQMDAQLATLAAQYTAQKAALNTQLSALYQQLFDEEQAQQQAAAAAAFSEADGADTTPTVTEQVIQAEIDQTKAEIDEKKSELTDIQKKVQAFCPSCPFVYNGLSTSCGARKDYLTSRYGTPNDDAILAVSAWVPGCTPGLN